MYRYRGFDYHRHGTLFYRPRMTLDHAVVLLLKLDHHIWDLDIFLRLILRRDLVDNVLLVLGDWLFADKLHQLAHPATRQIVYFVRGVWFTYVRPILSFSLAGG